MKFAYIYIYIYIYKLKILSVLSTSSFLIFWYVLVCALISRTEAVQAVVGIRKKSGNLFNDLKYFSTFCIFDFKNCFLFSVFGTDSIIFDAQLARIRTNCHHSQIHSSLEW